MAVLAVEVTGPANGEGAVSQYEPWTVTSHWDQVIVEKVQGFGGTLLPSSPGLLLVAFGVPQTLEQAPQRAVQAALALRRLVMEAAEGRPYPELRMAVHWGGRSHGAAAASRRHAGPARAATRVCRAWGNSGVPRDGTAGLGLVRAARA